MEKRMLGLFFPLIVILGVWGFNSVGDKAASLSTVYFAATVISLLLLFVCIFEVVKEKKWFILLFSSVSVVNAGYTFLSVSASLETALLANRISYLGSVFLPFFMLMIILQVTNVRFKKWLPTSLFVVAVGMFIIAASPGVFDIYYKDVSFDVVDGVSTLVKVYGPLHPLYLVYLIGYFASMVIVIIYASLKKKIDTVSHAAVLAIAVFVNIGVWFIEQKTSIDFEFLSLSYIISELFLLGIHLVMNENERLKEILKKQEETLIEKNQPGKNDSESRKNDSESRKNDSESRKNDSEPRNNDSESRKNDSEPRNNDSEPRNNDSESRKNDSEPRKNDNNSFISEEDMECFCQGIKRLTPTEKSIYEAYLCGTSTKEIMNTLNIKENTLKFHNKNIYGKLGISSRKRLLEIYRAITEDMKTNGDKAKFTIDFVERV